MNNLSRRSLLLAGTSLGIAPNLALAAGHSDLLMYGADMGSVDVANCTAIADEIAEIDTRIAEVQAAPESEIEAWYVQVSSSLDSQSATLKAALDAAQAAIDANDTDIKDEIIKAVGVANDLLLATAIQTRNPNFIGAAIGVNVTSGTAVLTYQVMSAESAEQSEGAVVTFVEGRKRMVTSLVTQKPGYKLAKKQTEMAAQLALIAFEILGGAVEASKLREHARELKKDLQALDARIVGLPGNVQQTREHMLDDLRAQREFYQLIQLAPNCMINSTPAPLPLPIPT